MDLACRPRLALGGGPETPKGMPRAWPDLGGAPYCSQRHLVGGK